MGHTLAAVALVVLSACGPAQLPPGDTIADRDEAQNRATHDFNLAVARSVFGGDAARGPLLPDPMRRGIGNFAGNLEQPSFVLNNLLQFRLGDAAQNTLRFAINTTIGIGGLFDPATALGVPAVETDFGETLHVYGLPEGDYVVLPFLGPSTTRDTLGMVVDVAINPLGHWVDPPERNYLRAVSAADRILELQENGETINDLIEGSADSYLLLRSLYLQNRRYQLGGSDAAAAADPYADPYFDPYADTAGADPAAAAPAPASDPYYDPYSDPYFDPYAQ